MVVFERGVIALQAEPIEEARACVPVDLIKNVICQRNIGIDECAKPTGFTVFLIIDVESEYEAVVIGHVPDEPHASIVQVVIAIRAEAFPPR